MIFEVVIGRGKKELNKFGKEGTIFLGKQYVQMGQTTSLSNPVYMDIAGSHVVFIVGKRGSGKSYTLGSIAEGLADLPPEIRENLSIVLIDTMGIYWTMKYPNFQDAELMKNWSMEPRPFDVKIYTPSGFYTRYKEEGLPTDFPFSIRPQDVGTADWCMTFGLNPNSAEGVLLTRIVQQLQKNGENYSLERMMELLRKDNESERVVQNIILNQLEKARGWEIFSEEGTPLKEIISPGQVTVLDISPYATMEGGWEIKSLVVGLICKNLFNQLILFFKIY